MASEDILTVLAFVPLASLGALLVGLLVFAFLVQTFQQWYRLSHVPGPFWASVSKYWLVQQSLKGRIHLSIKEVCDKYGSLARIGPNDLVTNDPVLLRKILAVRSCYKRGDWYDALRFDPDRDNLLSMRDDGAHTKLRKKMAPGYSGKENESMEGTIDRQIGILIGLIERKYISTDRQYRPMDIGEKSQYFTLDVITELAFGEAFGFLERDDDVFEYIETSRQFIPVMLVMANIPSLARLSQWRLFRGILPKETDKSGFGAFMGVANKLIAARYKPDAKQQRDMIASFMRHGLSQVEAQGEGLLQVIGGSDTTAATVRTVLLNLMCAPSVYMRLQAEVDSSIATGMISSPIKDSEARQMSYLQAVIKEALRIIPPAPGMFPKSVPEGGEVINGILIPEGTNIGSDAYGIHHSRAIFGDDADIFRPERWLEATGDQLADMLCTADLTFHVGKWQCLGKPVALMELNKVFVELLRRFDFSIVNANNPARYENVGVWVISDFWVRITRRTQN